MTASEPLVSIIIPAYNAAAYLPDSLRCVLGQTHPHVEAIVVDDGSTDGTAALLAEWAGRELRVRAVHQANQGLPSARNSGLRVARGEYIAFLDADDVIDPEKVARQLEHLQAHPDLDLVYSDYQMADERLRPLESRTIGVKRQPLRDVYAYTNLFPVMAALLRRSLVERVGDFDPALRACEDWDYWVRCAAVGRFGYLPGVTSTYRMHGSQMHRDLNYMLRYARQAAAKNFLPAEPQRYRTMIASLLWWQFGLQMREHGLNRLSVLRRPRVLLTALRMVWEVRSLREAWRIRKFFRHGM